MSKTFYESLSLCLNTYGAECFLCRKTVGTQPIFFSMIGAPKMYMYSRTSPSIAIPDGITDVFILCQYCQIDGHIDPNGTCDAIVNQMLVRYREEGVHRTMYTEDFCVVMQGLTL